jgi:hypothetical protein
MTSGHFVVMTLLASMAVQASALQGMISRPALLAPCAMRPRCTPLRAQGDGDIRIDIDGDSGDECVITDAGSTCLSADVAGPIRVDDLNAGHRTRVPPANEETRRRSPGLVTDFSAFSNADFRQPYMPPAEAEAVPARTAIRATAPPPRPVGMSFPFFAPRSTYNSIRVPSDSGY